MEKWINIKNEPYFARIDYGRGEKKYIGKNSVENYIIDWRDKVCNIYYQYNIYVGNKEYNLKLVRDFDINASVYNGFNDKFSDNIEYNNIDDIGNTNIISDEYLLNLIKQNRENKDIHDIIQTIQMNQYDIITKDEGSNILVLGCAGSGKTMILFHRLSYMLFNNPEIKPDDIYIISPSELLNIEGNDLSKSLNINAVNRMSTLKFNEGLIEDYYKLNQTYKLKNTNTISSNIELDQDIISNLYSKDFLDNFKVEIDDHLSRNNDKRINYQKNEEIKFFDRAKDFSNLDYSIADLTFTFKYHNLFHNKYLDLKKLVSELPSSSAIEKLNRLKKEYELINEPQKQLNNLYKQEILRDLIDEWKMSDKTNYSSKGEVLINESQINEVFSYFNAMGQKNLNNKNIMSQYPVLNEKFSNELEMFIEYKALDDKLERYKNFKLAKNDDYYSELIACLINNIKSEYNISLDKTYEFELYLNLIACNVKFGNLSTVKKYVFIDEFQDYSVTELELYKNILPKVVFNFYGDIKQNINTKGLFDNDLDLIIDEDWSSFKINENYRNAHQITEYINDILDVNMRPIGIDGIVKLIDINKDKIQFRFDNDDRVAFIVKNISIFDTLWKNNVIDYKYKSKLNPILNENVSIQKNMINIIPVNLVKGLEFEQVYVVEQDLSENEIYVAYTRALRELNIIKIK